MTKVCDFSGKSVVAGRRIQHHHSEGWRFKAPRTTRLFKPNIRSIKVKDAEGKVVKMNISMKYYKRLRDRGHLDIKDGEKAGRYFFMPNAIKEKKAKKEKKG